MHKILIDEATAKQALEALEGSTDKTLSIRAMKALRKALAQERSSDEQPAQQDIPDLIAGTLGVSRGTAYEMMREALKDTLPAQPQQEPVASDFEKWLGQPSYHDGFGRSPDLWSLKQIQAAVAAMLAAAPQPQQEPVAFPARRAVEREIERTANPTGMHLNDGKERVALPGGTLRHMLALIDRTSPPAQRKPLTDDEIESINVRLAGRRDLARLFARAIEAAHGIKENT